MSWEHFRRLRVGVHVKASPDHSLKLSLSHDSRSEPFRVCFPYPLKMSATAGEQKPDTSLSGAKRPAVDGDGKQLSEKKLRRLEKNRLSARECRRRKREATENLASQINMLEGENLRLRLQLQVCTYLLDETVSCKSAHSLSPISCRYVPTY